MIEQRDWEEKIDFKRLRKYRSEKLDRFMKEDDLDAILTMRVDHIRYVTSFRALTASHFFSSRYVAIKKRGDDPFLLVASGDYDRAKNYMPWLKGRVNPLPMNIMLAVPTFNKVLKELGLNDAKIASDDMTFQLYNRLKKENPKLEIVDGWPTISKAKAVKNKDEQALLKASSEIAEVGMRAAIDRVGEGVTEIEVAAEAQKAMTEAGSEGGHLQPPLVASGENTISLTRFPTNKRIRNGELVLIDLGCTYNGYNSDFTRTVICGKPREEQKKIYKTVYESLWKAIKSCKPGEKSSYIDKVSRDVIRKNGYEKYWYFGVTGHGIGISLQEPPIIGEVVAKGDVEWILEEGMTFSLEPSIHLPKVGGVRLEDSVIVTEDGYEVITKTEYDEKLLS